MALLARPVSLAVLLALWQGISSYAEMRSLPAPSAVLAFILREARNGDLLFNVGVTLARVAVSFVIAMSLGVLLGIALGRSRLADRLLDTPLLVVLTRRPWSSPCSPMSGSGSMRPRPSSRWR